MNGVAPDCASACPVCGDSDAQLYLNEEERPLNAAEFGPSRRNIAPGRILRCRRCSFGFRQTRYAPAQLAEVYRRMDTGLYESEIEGRKRTARAHLRIVERHAGRGRILDAGCASGIFLQQAAAAGWQVTGVEPSDSLCRHARAALAGAGEIHCSPLEEARLNPGFDVVTLWDVLEHVPQPVSFLAVCAGLLKPKGYLFANVPDLDSLEARLLGRRWPLLLPEHLNYFNRPSLEACGMRAGLKLIRFGRRPVWFSARYIAFRIAQHGVPGARLLAKVTTATPLGRLALPVRMGETYAVWRKPDEVSAP